MLLHQLVKILIVSVAEEEEYIQRTKQLIREDAMIITAKMAGAEGGDVHNIRMQNATITRNYVLHLYLEGGSSRFHQCNKNLEYVPLIRTEIQKFRLLLIE
jgi:hypothetical protein